VRVLLVEDEKRLAAGLKEGDWRPRASSTAVALTGTDGPWLARGHPRDSTSCFRGSTVTTFARLS
jgi:hypothetical protein